MGRKPTQFFSNFALVFDCPRNTEHHTVAGIPDPINGNIYRISSRRPLNSSFLARPSDLLGVHLKGSVFLNQPGQLGYMLLPVPRDKAGQAVVGPKDNVPVQPRAATNSGACVKCIQPRL